MPFDATPGFGQGAGTASAGHLLTASGLSAYSGSPAALGTAGAVVLVMLLALAVVAASRRLVRLRRLPAALRPYASSQLWLRCLGLPLRRPAQTPHEHLARLTAACPDAGAAVRPLVDAVDSGLYASAPTVRRPAWRIALVTAGVPRSGDRRPPRAAVLHDASRSG